MRKLFSLAGALLLGACASVPMAPPADDAAGKRFDPPAPGEAALYFVRPGGTAPQALVPLSVGQRQVGALPPYTYLRVDVPPGRYDVRCTTPEASAAIQISLQAGETKYIDTGVRIGLMSPRCAVEEIDPERGRGAVMGAQRAQEIR